MWEGLLGSIRQMGVFMICAQALIYFKPKGSYEKYLKLLVSAMILVQILSPVAALLSGKEGQGLEERIAFYNRSFEQGMGEAALEEYRIEQIRQQLLTGQIEAQVWNWQLEGGQATASGTAEENRAETVSGAAGEDRAETGQGATGEDRAETGQDAAGEDRTETGQGAAGEDRTETGQDTAQEAIEVRLQIDPVTVEMP